MWGLARLKPFLIIIATTCSYDGPLISFAGSVFASNAEQQSQGRIQVPLGRRLADAIGEYADRRSNHPSNTPRQYEIEADGDDTTKNDGATKKLMVEEVQRMAVTAQTTYSFHKDREFNHEKIKDISILASNPKEVEGITILSIDTSNGNVRGFQRGRTGHARQITSTVDSNHRILRLTNMERSLGDDRLSAKNWTCDTAHAHDDDPLRSRDDHHDHHDHHHSESFPLKQNFARSSINPFKSFGTNAGGSSISSGWIQNPKPKYSFHVDISIDIDKHFIEKQGSTEAAVEYINVLISAANTVFEYEVDAHLNVVHIQETDIYDELTTTKDALREMRLQPRPEYDGNSKIILHHALLGRYVGGGIAFIDSVCDNKWGYGVTSDISGSLQKLDELVLFDFFIFTHEIGHSLGSGHTFDGYEPPVDACGACTITPQQGGTRNGASVQGLPRKNSATLMSYCNFCDGGLSNIAITLGGVWDGNYPRTDLQHWNNHPDIVGSVSKEPRRVSHNVWQRLASKGECVKPPSDPLPTQGCNDDGDCDDFNRCTVDACTESNVCAIINVLERCCGNGKCEEGEGQSCSDCGPFHIQAPSICENCHTLDGFMIDVGVSDKAEKKIFIDSITLAYAMPQNEDGATIDVYVSNNGSYIGKEKSVDEWEKVTTVTALQYNQKRETGILEVELHHSIPVGIGKRRGLYFAASEDILKFGEKPYSIRNDHEVELYSSLAVSGLFGDGINGFSLSCGVSYTLDGTSRPVVSLSESDKSSRTGEPLSSRMTSPPSASPVVDPSETPSTPPLLPPPPPSNHQSEDDIMMSSASPTPKPSEKSQLVSPAAKAQASAGSKRQFWNCFVFISTLLLLVYTG